jgi:lipopolysaccharide export system protein LptA
MTAFSLKRALWLLAFCLILLPTLRLPAQAPTDTRLDNKFSVSRFHDTPKGPEMEMLLLGDHSSNVTKQVLLVWPFETITFHNGQTNLTAQAPQCHVDVVSNVAWDSSHLILYTPTTNVFVQGDGFFFTQSNHVLVLSNNVETRILRSLLKSSLLTGGQTNAPSRPNETIQIYAQHGQFDYVSNHVEYAGKVHVIDSQMDLTSDFLFVQLNTNGAIENIQARQNVVITTTNKGRATGETAVYHITAGSEIMDLTGNAFWRNGDQEASAEHFNYDSTRHILSATNHVRVRWPNAPESPSDHEAGIPPRTDAGGDRILFADDATMQLPPTNGPVESMIANGNVIIVNQADQSRSTGDHAVYSRAGNRFQLTGSPVWWNDRIKVQGDTLTAEVTNRIYHTRGHSRFEMITGRATNQLVVISATNIDYQTNLAVFKDDVHTTLLQDGALRDTLDCNLLNVELVSNEAVAAVAIGNVRGETAPDRMGVVKTITCATLTAHRSPVTLLMKDLEATNEVVIRQFGKTTNAPRNTLTAESVIAEFFPHTNQIEKAVAEHDVVIEQIKPAQTIHATAARAVYTVTNDEVKLTGAPLATTDQLIISDADALVWKTRTNQFRWFGPYKIVPIKSKTGHPSS